MSHQQKLTMNHIKAMAMTCALAFINLFSLTAVYSIFRKRRYKQLLLERQTQQTPKFKGYCETTIYFRSGTVRIKTASFLNHEKEYYGIN